MHVVGYLPVQPGCLHPDHPTHWVYIKHAPFARLGTLSRYPVSDDGVAGVGVIPVHRSHLDDGVP